MIVSMNVAHFVNICQVLTILHQLICKGIANFGTRCSTDRWAVPAKIRQNGCLGGHRGQTGSINMAATQKIERALVTSFRPSIVTFPLSQRVSEILPLLCSSMPLFPPLL